MEELSRHFKTNTIHHHPHLQGRKQLCSVLLSARLVQGVSAAFLIYIILACAKKGRKQLCRQACFHRT